MDEPQSNSGRVWPHLLLLLLIALVMRVWQVSTTEVAARDSVAYVRIAWLLEHNDWRQVIPKSQHHPGYPLSILAVSSVVRQMKPGSLPDVMQLSAQIASSIASVLLVLPMFYIGLLLLDRRIAFWSTLLFQCLPASGRLLGDALSEPLFLLFATTALLLAVIAFRRRSVWYFAGVGLFGALAYLTRPEGGLIVASTGIVLTVMQMFRATRLPWKAYAAAAACLCVAALMLAGPFMILIRGVSTKNTANIMFYNGKGTSNDRPTRPQQMSSVTKHPAVFAVFWEGNPGFGEEKERKLWALTTLLGLMAKLFYYVGWIPLFGALWFDRHRLRAMPGFWLLLLTATTMLPLLYTVALKMGYLSDRHAMLNLCCTGYWSVAGMVWMGQWCAGLFRGRAWARPGPWAVALPAAVCLIGLCQTLQPLHGERGAFRQAGYLLAEQVQPSDDIDDAYTWASYYAGRYFVDQLPAHKPGTPRTVYVLFEASSNKHQELKPAANMDFVREKGHMIQSWPVRLRHETAEVQLWKLTY